jgi:hypothetical protein
MFEVAISTADWLPHRHVQSQVAGSQGVSFLGRVVVAVNQHHDVYDTVPRMQAPQSIR